MLAAGDAALRLRTRRVPARDAGADGRRAAIIKPHRDANPAAKWPHKIHVPIQTNDQVAFLVGDTEYHFPEGEAVEVNNMGVHAVRNGGDSDRIHLIFEYYDLDQPGPECRACRGPLRVQRRSCHGRG